MTRRPLDVLVALLLVGATACAGADSEPSAASTSTTARIVTTTTAAPVDVDPIATALAEPHTSVVATALADQVTVYAEPAATAAVTMTLPRYDPDYVGDDGEQTVQSFLVEAKEGPWLRVLLPVRPNGTTGWIRLADVTLSQHQFEIVVELGAHRLIATEAGEPFLDTDIAVGTRDTPTPGGRFYLNALLQPPDPDTIYGTYAYALSGYSDTLQRFAGGDGVIGIHGTNDPSVMGSDVSHGCIRMRNEDIEQLVAVLPLGTPVEIRS